MVIGAAKSEQWNIVLDANYHLNNFTLHQSLLSPNVLSFTLNRDPDESAEDPRFTACGQIIGKPLNLILETMTVGDEGDKTATIEFSGFVVSAYGSRSGTQYYINVEACSWDALLEDNLSCKSFENKSLSEIVGDVTEEYNQHLQPIIDPRDEKVIPYCVQYNETNYQFLQRLACRYGEWLYNTGTQIVFGNLQQKETVMLKYPSQDVPSYTADLKVCHVAFNHLASSYNTFNRKRKDGVGEMMRQYSELSEQVYAASQDLYTKETLQNLHSGGYAKADNTDTRDAVLAISTKTQGRGEKAGMLTYSGTTYCSKLKIGGKLNIEDNYLNEDRRSDVMQDEILITELTHHFSIDHTYSNSFVGISSKCDYPPYSNSDVYPVAPSCRAKVKDNEDPNGLGRVRVQFDWQILLSEETGQEMMTPWLRIVQPYAGGGKGFSFIPEKDEEVMIGFEGGNAERPYVMGTLYNGVDDVDRKWVSNSNSHNQVKAIRTRNGHTVEIHDEGNDGYIRIYDNEKENYILTFSTDRKLIMLQSTGNIELYANNDIIMHAGHDINVSADHDITTSSGNDTSESAGNDMFLEAAHDQQRTADNDIREHAGNDRVTTIDRNDSLTVTENQFIMIDDNKDEQVAHKFQLTAENIRTEAQDQLLEYSNTHHIKAGDQTAINAGSRIDIKAGVVKVQ